MQKRGGFSSKSGQVTIFIIIGILIIAAAAVVYFLIPKTQTGTGFDTKNPNGFIQSCLQNEMKSDIVNISLHGGSANPEFSFNYNGQPVEYLCYTAENYATCIVQRSLLQAHVESEIEKAIAPSVQNCFSSLINNYKNEGYQADVKIGKTIVSLLPGKVLTNFSGYSLNVSKGETSKYGSFNIVLNNNLYELVNIANSIVDWETRYGDAPADVYMTYYKDIKVEKIVQDDGTKIYILTDRNSGLKFQFASRSSYFPPGYGAEGIAV